METLDYLSGYVAQLAEAIAVAFAHVLVVVGSDNFLYGWIAGCYVMMFVSMWLNHRSDRRHRLNNMRHDDGNLSYREGSSVDGP